MRGTGKSWLLLAVTAAKLGVSLSVYDSNLPPGIPWTRTDGKPRGKGKRTKDWQR